MTGNKGIYQNWHLKWAQLPPPPHPNAHLEPEQLWGLNPSSQELLDSFTASTSQINAIPVKYMFF